MGGITSLLSDAKGVLTILLIIAATVLAGVGQLSVADWKTFVTYIFGIYAGAAALHGGLASIGNGIGARGAGTVPATPPLAVVPPPAK